MTIDRIIAPDLLGIGAGLNAMNQKLGKVHQWAGDSDLQRQLLPLIGLATAAAGSVRGLVGIADKDYRVINAHMEDKGFGPDFMEPFEQGLGLAGGLKYENDYKVPGRYATVERQGRVHDAVRLSTNDHRVGVYVGLDKAPVIAVPMKGEDYLLVMPFVEGIRPFDLLLHCMRTADLYLRNQLRLAGSYNGVVVPLVDIRKAETDISFMKGMRADGWNITRAKQLVLFQLGITGVRVESKTQMVVERSTKGPEGYLVINDGFIAVVVKREIESVLPIFSGRPSIEDWKNPGM